jgi:hypothetical protein
VRDAVADVEGFGDPDIDRLIEAEGVAVKWLPVSVRARDVGVGDSVLE